MDEFSKTNFNQVGSGHIPHIYTKISGVANFVGGESFISVTEF